MKKKMKMFCPPLGARTSSSNEGLQFGLDFCRATNRVVPTYDHRCLILGATIGERNRARFWLFLCTHSIALAYSLYIVRSGFHEARRGKGRGSRPTRRPWSPF